MSNKRSLDQTISSQSGSASGESLPASLTQSKKVKFGVIPTSSTSIPSSSSSRLKDQNNSSTFEPVDNSTDLQFDELNQVGKIKKGRIKVDGYDSDSSTENNEVRKPKKDKSRQKDNDDDEEDMFGTDKDQDKNPGDSSINPKFDKIDVGLNLKKGAESKDYLELGDIEGQEFGKGADDDDDDGDDDEEEDGQGRKKGRKEHNGAEGSNDDYSDEEEDYVPGDEFANADDAPRARRKSKRGMGFLLSKFNMADELKEGRMTADGSYVQSAKDPEAVHDNWLEGVNSKKAIKQAREAKRRREEQLRSQAENEGNLTSIRTRKECYIALLELLPAGDGRTVSQILCQLGNEKRGLQRPEKKKKVGTKNPIDELVPESMISEPTPTDLEPHSNGDNNNKGQLKTTSINNLPKSDEEVRLTKMIGEITDLASTLMGTHGDLDIYDMTHGSILGILKSEGLVPRDWQPAATADKLPNLSKKADDPNDQQPNLKGSANNASRKPLISRPTAAAALSGSSHPLDSSHPPSSIYYRFLADPSSSGLADPTTYGPFDRPTMESWAQQGFFGQAFERILVKIDHSPSGSATWGSWDQIISPK